ncbi:hypothetical protein [Paenibacillus solani]|uniref:Uncharacterized protein n=1 Tax=Paenibacillus solani TaxID=1705565 RepID=A0A0M1N1N6_9BACL|nr:hypothetical protein [Paenibacillus solani]KOR76076.1 hypothetical protein AM231_25880 [Paenibacillus solani]
MAKLRIMSRSSELRWSLSFPIGFFLIISSLSIFWLHDLWIDLGLPSQDAVWINMAITGTYLIGYLAGVLYVYFDRWYVDTERSNTEGDNLHSGPLKKRILLQFPLFLFVVLNILCFYGVHGLFRSYGLSSWYAYYLHLSLLCLYWFGYGCSHLRAYLQQKQERA